MTQGLSVDTLQTIADAFNRHDLDEIMAYFAANAVLETPRGPEPWGRRFEGKEAVRDGLAARFSGILDVHYGDDEHLLEDRRGVRLTLVSRSRTGRGRCARRG